MFIVMAIVSMPKELNDVEPLSCAICRVRLVPDKATAGLLNGRNRQVYACVSHFSEVELLILGWADFTARERVIYAQNKQAGNALLFEGGNNARFDS